jgi:hypothetical protein
MWRQCSVDLLGGTWWGLIVFIDSQNRPHTHPRHPRFHRGVAKFDVSRLVLAGLGADAQSNPAPA